MKLLHVISSVNFKGGGLIQGVKQLYAPMKSLGVDLEVVCCASPNAAWIANCSLPRVHLLGRAKGAYIVNGIWQYYGLAIWRALAGTKVPYFVFTHSMSMVDLWFKYTYPLKHLKKWLHWQPGEYRVLCDAWSVERLIKIIGEHEQ